MTLLPRRASGNSRRFSDARDGAIGNVRQQELRPIAAAAGEIVGPDGVGDFLRWDGLDEKIEEHFGERDEGHCVGLAAAMIEPIA